MVVLAWWVFWHSCSVVHRYSGGVSIATLGKEGVTGQITGENKGKKPEVRKQMQSPHLRNILHFCFWV